MRKFREKKDNHFFPLFAAELIKRDLFSFHNIKREKNIASGKFRKEFITPFSVCYKSFKLVHKNKKSAVKNMNRVHI